MEAKFVKFPQNSVYLQNKFTETMKTTILSLFCLMAMSLSAADYEVSSPNGKVKVTVTSAESVTWSVTYDGKTVLLPS